MQKSAFSLLIAAFFALTLAGCFGGEEDAATNPIVPVDSTKAAKKLSPGLYAGVYSPYDTNDRWESEFTLSQDGSFRFFWILDNEPIGDIMGKWFQKDSSLHFNTMTETYVQNSGFFGTGESIEDDTNSVREVTDSSFVRKEWTLMRQKPYWVTYKKKSLGQLKSGSYEYSRDIKLDSVTNLRVQIKISFDGTAFLYTYKEDTLESFQAAARWYQIGSILGTEENRGRSYIDSLKAFGAWDSIPGALLQRVQDVSDTAFHMWSAGNMFVPGSWDVYSKVK